MAVRGRRSERASVILRDEGQAWAYLAKLQESDYQTNGDTIAVRGWPEFHFKFWIEGQNILLTAPVMQAMIDYQTSINRAFMLVMESTAGLKGLSEEERKQFELIFKVRRGSTDLSFNAQQAIEKFMEVAAGKLTGRQLVIIVIAFAVLFAGVTSWHYYLENQRLVAEQTASSQTHRDELKSRQFASQQETERMRILAQALTAAGDRRIMEASEEGKKAVVKAASTVKDTEIGGKRIPPEMAKRMYRNARTKPAMKAVVGEYDVKRVDTDVSDGFRVKLQSRHSNETVFASVRDAVLSENDRALIRRGEWEKKPIVARLYETRRRGELVSARVDEVLKVVGDEP